MVPTPDRALAGVGRFPAYSFSPLMNRRRADERVVASVVGMGPGCALILDPGLTVSP
jgi:hypothetical protein